MWLDRYNQCELYTYSKYPLTDYHHIQQIQTTLDTFTPHDLDDLKNANLMDRVDTKYVCSKQHLTPLLSYLNAYYSILEIKGDRLFNYQNIYYDTKSYALYTSHHNAKLNRFKIRSRYYQNSDLAFLEVKYKNNKGRTRKTRIRTTNSPFTLTREQEIFIQNQGYKNACDLSAKQFSTYQRIALANESLGERITIDTQLFFQEVDDPSKHRLLENMCIIEVKQKQYNIQSACIRYLKALGLRPTPFSKYCMGMALINVEGIKTNRFKRHLQNVS